MTTDAENRGWTVWADRGGTFTDCIGRDPQGRLHTLKLLSTAPGQYDDAVVEGVRRLLGLAPQDPFPDGGLSELRLGTTITTNALLEERHQPCALLTNAGFEDLLAIGDQARPELFALAIPPRRVLCSAIRGLGLRRDYRGSVVAAADDSEIADQLGALRAAGHDSLAIALAHAHRAPDDEQRIAGMARQQGFSTVVCSHEVSPRPGLLARMQTAVVEAALAPLLARYRAQLAEALPGARIRVMQSDGQLVLAERLTARNSIFSGPAGGVIGATGVGAACGEERVLGLDMGGTSTDVFQTEQAASHTLPLRDAAVINRQEVRAPTLDLHTVAAGGGSRLHFDGQRLRVGPDSAGADPGPACYGRGGPATVTDANVALGRVWLAGFAPRFGPEGDAPLDPEAARAALARLGQNSDREPCDPPDNPSPQPAANSTPETDGRQAASHRAQALAPDALAVGALRIAVENMASAVRRISVARGVDIRKHCLVAFGGAGPQHACDVAEALGVRRVRIPARASLLSAAGMGSAAVGLRGEDHIGKPLSQVALDEAQRAADALLDTTRCALQAEGARPEACEQQLLLRYADSETLIAQPFDTLEAVRSRFAEAHEQSFGFIDPERAIRIETVQCRVSQPAEPLPEAPVAATARTESRQRLCLLNGGWQEVPVFARLSIEPVEGPALIVLDQSSFLLNAGWRAHADGHGIAAERAPAADKGADPARSSATDAARLELFNNRFMAIATEMGEALQRSAQSVNVRNRLDYSCALFDADGQLVANAPHIPVHLGSMGASVRAVLARAGDALEADSAWLINDPYAGGTHLPDLTLVMPVCDGSGRRALVAARAHHADIGGISPGSMPAGSRHIDEEGVRIDGLCVARAGRLFEAELRQRLGAGPYPARNIDANLADLRAQLAACARGVGLLQQLMTNEGADTVCHFMQRVQDYTAERISRALTGLRPASHRVTLDSGAAVAVSLRAAGPPAPGRLEVDFGGSSAMDPGNANAPEAVVRAAVMYALRCLLPDDIPLNEGFLRAVDLRLPHPGLLSPVYPAAVVAGNVETSQAVADALLVALSAVAESQGTMNNFSFGNAACQYYETLCGGSGAGPGFHGASAVHSHMTNSRITDIEIIEQQYPVRLLRFALRRGSGGDGQFRGGDGVLREWLFLAPMELALISNRRQHAPSGAAGGGDGAPGENRLIHPDGHQEDLGGSASRQLAAGSRVCIATPGGGGWGRPERGAALRYSAS